MTVQYLQTDHVIYPTQGVTSYIAGTQHQVTCLIYTKGQYTCQFYLQDHASLSIVFRSQDHISFVDMTLSIYLNHHNDVKLLLPTLELINNLCVKVEQHFIGMKSCSYIRNICDKKEADVDKRSFMSSHMTNDNTDIIRSCYTDEAHCKLCCHSVANLLPNTYRNYIYHDHRFIKRNGHTIQCQPQLNIMSPHNEAQHSFALLDSTFPQDHKTYLLNRGIDQDRIQLMYRLFVFGTSYII